MKLLLLLIMSFVCVSVFGQEPSKEIEVAAKNSVFKDASSSFKEGKYHATVIDLSAIEQKINEKILAQSLLGLTYYWKAICYNRLQDFPSAISYFDKSLVDDSHLLL